MFESTIIKNKYRPEIDGLRAFAVLVVIINHFNKDILPSGYLGVDIFFVISGYVITSSLYRRKELIFRKFISEFYIARILRLMPALILFTFIASVFICFFNLDPQVSLRTGISSLFGFSNMYLLKQSTDYFAESSEMNIFTHTWSLGVETQFYFFFPFLTWFTGFQRQTQKGFKNLTFVILLLLIFSLIFFIDFYQTNEPAAYFLMPTRFWELATGVLIFLQQIRDGNMHKFLKNLSPLYIFLVMILVLCLPKSFPILTTTLVVFLSALLISCLRKESLLFNIFTNKNIVFIGLISYSLYLWHWGIVSISRWTIGIHWWSIPFQAGLIFLFATFSYKFIEKPIRESIYQKRFTNILKIYFSLILGAISLFTLERFLSEKIYLGNSNIEEDLQYYNLFLYENFCHSKDQKKILNPIIPAKCIIEKEQRSRTLFFIGDSHNTALLDGSVFIANKTNSNLNYIHHIFPHIPRRSVKKTKEELDLEKNELISKTKSGDIIFMTYRYPYRFYDKRRYWFLRNIQSTYNRDFDNWLSSLEEFTSEVAKKNVQVIISTPTPEFPSGDYKSCINQKNQWFNKLGKKICFYPYDFFASKNPEYYQIIKKLNRISNNNDNMYLFDALKVMCPNSECKHSIGSNLLYRDSNHLSRYGSRFIIAPQIIKFLQINKLILEVN